MANSTTHEHRARKINKIVFWINGFLFLIGGLLLVNEDKLFLSIFQFAGALLNFLSLIKYSSRKTVKKLSYSVLTINIIICLSIALDNIHENKMYIQYIWFLAAALSLIALIIFLRRHRHLIE